MRFSPTPAIPCPKVVMDFDRYHYEAMHARKWPWLYLLPFGDYGGPREVELWMTTYPTSILSSLIVFQRTSISLAANFIDGCLTLHMV